MSLELLKERRSVRRFKRTAVPLPLLRELIECAALAPSAGNRQDWFFSVSSTPETIREIASCVKLKWDEAIGANQDSGLIEDFARYAAQLSDFAEVPTLIAVSAATPTPFEKKLLDKKTDSVWGGAASAAMAAQNLMLGAAAHGIGSCCMTGALIAEDEIKRIMEIKRRQQIVCLIALGYPDETPIAAPRKNIDEIARFL